MTGGRTVLITGGSRGIGRACVERFAAAGDRVAFLYRSREEDAAAVADATGALAVRADVSDPICVREAFAQVQAVLGDPAVLVNCAGVAHIGLLQDMTDSEWPTPTCPAPSTSAARSFPAWCGGNPDGLFR